MSDLTERVDTVKHGIEQLLQTKLTETPVNPRRAFGFLKALRDLPVTLDVLKATRVGLCVNELRKRTNNSEVRNLGKVLIKRWKKLLGNLEEADPSAHDTVTSTTEMTEVIASVSSSTSPRTSAKKTAGSRPKQNTRKRKKGRSKRTKSIAEEQPGIGIKIKRAKNGEMHAELSVGGTQPTSTTGVLSESENVEGSRPPSPSQASQSSPDRSGTEGRSAMEDAIRQKSKELLLNAANGDGNLPDGAEDPETLVEQLESCIFKEFKDTGFKYKCRIRSRLSNLKDVKNPDLRIQFLLGHIPPAQLARMSAEEMANSELKSLRARIVQESINKAQLAVNPGAKSELLKCSKCGGRNCTYSQLQTQSSDEPMTTFVLCNDCGNRWKFN